MSTWADPSNPFGEKEQPATINFINFTSLLEESKWECDCCIWSRLRAKSKAVSFCNAQIKIKSLIPLSAGCQTFNEHNEPTKREGLVVCACKCENTNSEKELERVSNFSPEFTLIYSPQFTKLGIFCQIKTEDHVSKYNLWSYLEMQAKKPVDAIWDDLQTLTYKSKQI